MNHNVDQENAHLRRLKEEATKLLEENNTDGYKTYAEYQKQLGLFDSIRETMNFADIFRKGPETREMFEKCNSDLYKLIARRCQTLTTRLMLVDCFYEDILVVGRIFKDSTVEEKHKQAREEAARPTCLIVPPPSMNRHRNPYDSLAWEVAGGEGAVLVPEGLRKHYDDSGAEMLVLPSPHNTLAVAEMLVMLSRQTRRPLAELLETALALEE